MIKNTVTVLVSDSQIFQLYTANEILIFMYLLLLRCYRIMVHNLYVLENPDYSFKSSGIKKIGKNRIAISHYAVT